MQTLKRFFRLFRYYFFTVSHFLLTEYACQQSLFITTVGLALLYTLGICVAFIRAVRHFDPTEIRMIVSHKRH